MNLTLKCATQQKLNSSNAAGHINHSTGFHKGGQR